MSDPIYEMTKALANLQASIAEQNRRLDAIEAYLAQLRNQKL